ncbi:MAG TPA: cyclic nucleotide-binding domain-containing protein [Deltaproteobacteria bacterium]|jgi:CRP-like cAMP-binding protein|nr:cyclic nucleotide-binding domain-containing protein [Deltaproteobacteria bacterium]HRW79713.1 cyclic nucleotide-binding domain-containing protein [Desulfomonilia bacterium]NMD41645.1 cyclic nucleotide-binding domain-containing protein [Deltaproteobacteria bacterium]HNQ86669.1 cyclic nucleotide-binding domain-containing protein [Deltaproteobacteria bacterium]HNS90740.1 cyclic nucleotide-binding domain-containing protein [Deltaproteobacteria bacterium]
MQETPYLKDRSDLIEIIRKIPFLRSYSDMQLLDILSLSKMRKFAPGERITREGELDSWLYIILSGEVIISNLGTAIAMISSPGSTIGEMAIVDGEPRSASVDATAETTTLAIDMSVTERMSDAGRERFDAVFYRLLAKILVDRLRKTSHELSQARDNIKELTDAILLQQTETKK